MALKALVPYINAVYTQCHNNSITCLIVYLILFAQTNIELSGSDLETEQTLARVIENVHNGKFKGTALLNRSDKKLLFNI